MPQSLWPHAASLAADVRNECKLDNNGVSPLDKLSEMKNSFNLKDKHVFGCQACVLQSSIQDHNSIPR